MSRRNNNNEQQNADILRMKEMFTSGGLNRREFMQGLMATGLTMSAAGVLVAGSGSALAATPKKGGKLTFAWDQHGPADV